MKTIKDLTSKNIMNISKIIPYNIRIKSLYWVRKENEINNDLFKLFQEIDNDNYESANLLIKQLEQKWIPISHTAPQWFVYEYIPQFAKAHSMLSFLQCENKK